jgi:twitching motility protein PilI
MAERTSLRDYQRELADRLRGAEAGRGSAMLALQIGGEGWLVDLGEAGELIPVPPISALPLTRPWFKGVTNIRGRLFSVIDFPAFCGGKPIPLNDQSRLLLLGEQFRTGAAVLVDRSLGLRNLTQLTQIPHEGEAPWVRARYSEAGGKSWRALDVAQLVQHDNFLAVAA